MAKVDWPFNQAQDSQYYDMDKDVIVGSKPVGGDEQFVDNVFGKRTTVSALNKWIESYPSVPIPMPAWTREKRLVSSDPIRDTVQVDVLIAKALTEGEKGIRYIGPSAGGISVHGLRTDELVSGLHKYIRRCWFTKAMWCLVERETFNDLPIDQPSQKAFSTRMFNRLGPILSCEDVGIGSPYLPLLVDRLETAIRGNDAHIRRRAYWQLVHNQLLCEKSREASHIRSVYWTALSVLGMEILQSKWPEIYLDAIEKMKTGFKRLVVTGSDWAFYRILKSYHRGDHKRVIAYMEWLVSRYYEFSDLGRVLIKWYKTYTFKERFIFPVHLLLVVMRRREQVVTAGEPTWTLPRDCWQATWIANLDPGSNPIVLDDFVVDMHTSRGKKHGKSGYDFGTEGSIVYNESPVTNQVYKSIYIYLKTSSAVSAAEEVTSWPKAQILTSKHKKYTYLSFDWVVKGPFSSPKELARLAILEARIEALRTFNHPNILLYEIRTDVSSSSSGEKWLWNRNISQVPVCNWVVNRVSAGKAAPVHPDGDGENMIEVVDRASMGIWPLNKLPIAQQARIMFKGQYPLIVAYMIMALVNAGDQGPWNCIVADETPYLIDYEDSSAREGFQGPNALFARDKATAGTWVREGLIEHRESLLEQIEKLADHLLLPGFPEADTRLAQIRTWLCGL